MLKDSIFEKEENGSICPTSTIEPTLTVEQQRRSHPPISHTSNDISSSTSPILTLPGEILVNILSYVVVDPQKAVILRSAAERRWRNELQRLLSVDWNQPIQSRYYCRDPIIPNESTSKSLLLDVLLVSRQFYFAGIAAFFGENTIGLDDARGLQRFTEDLDTDRRYCIRNLEINFRLPNQRTGLWDRDPFESAKMLSAGFVKLPSLQSATFVFTLNNVTDHFGLKAQRDKILSHCEEMKDHCSRDRVAMSLRIEVGDYDDEWTYASL